MLDHPNKPHEVAQIDYVVNKRLLNGKLVSMVPAGVA
jgi:hypothetical protein